MLIISTTFAAYFLCPRFQRLEVKRDNQLLKGLNFPICGSLSLYNPSSRKAIQEFQERNNFLVTGITDWLKIEAWQNSFLDSSRGNRFTFSRIFIKKNIE